MNFALEPWIQQTGLLYRLFCLQQTFHCYIDIENVKQIDINCTGLLGAPIIWQYSWRKLRGAVGQWLPTSRWPGALWPLGKMIFADWDSNIDFQNNWSNKNLWAKLCVALVGPCRSIYLCIQSHSTSGHQTVTQQHSCQPFTGIGVKVRHKILGFWAFGWTICQCNGPWNDTTSMNLRTETADVV